MMTNQHPPQIPIIVVGPNLIVIMPRVPIPINILVGVAVTKLIVVS